MTCITPIHWLQSCCPPVSLSLAGLLCPQVDEETKPDGAGGRKHAIVFPRDHEEAKKKVKELLVPIEKEVSGVVLSVDMPQMPGSPIDVSAPPIHMTDDSEIVALIRKNEIERHRLLVEAIIEDENKLMEEVAVLVMLDA